MRLVCPNCDAKYEVPDGAIPEGGRDVQCSACGHAWFQAQQDPFATPEPAAVDDAWAEADSFDDELSEDPAAVGRTPALDDFTPPPLHAAGQGRPVAEALAQADAEAELQAALNAPSAEFEVTDAEPPAQDDAALQAAIGAVLQDSAPPPAPGAPLMPRPELDEDLRALLREEAEREAEARRIEAQRAGRKAEAEGQMQVQPELAIDAAGAGLTPVQRRLAMLEGRDPDAAPPEPPRPPARRDLLPDVEEINSTLQPGDAAALDAEVEALPDLTSGSRSFRVGFLFAILILLLASAAYVLAPQLGAQLPQIQPHLDSYVSFVDGLRIWLNQQMNAATASLTSTAS
ncbi:zinc-ribbon domain-containing protein [Xinfangfangia sp. CPCC 101601]|uniref:Zinc-ribbon domain-containing protein n=1 Tax=Pseudogemmobacter lacusdianii TaxID=3069608 RepID=A0ABU0VX77_9RHOB|nr:zinc-ribbon domain-containing protein [Xinfangfangia sp. CPCC 101601]MDQ2066361.1 zinc-ribbon domain-containing protein [Xinfangfangia sp. CPCC 101601]